MNKKILLIGFLILIIASVGILGFIGYVTSSTNITVPNMDTNYISFTNGTFEGVSFSYPANWTALHINSTDNSFDILLNNVNGSTNLTVNGEAGSANISGNQTNNTINNDMGNDSIALFEFSNNYVLPLKNLTYPNYNYVSIGYNGIDSNSVDSLANNWYSNLSSEYKNFNRKPVFKQNGLDMLEINYINSTNNHNMTIYLIQNTTNNRTFEAYCNILPNNTEDMTKYIDTIIGTFKIQ